METYEFSFGFELGCLHIAPVHVRIEQLSPVIAAHRHSNASYEIHYTRSGQGDVTIDGKTRAVGPDTLYVTGPGVEHAQRSDPRSPILEYCLYLNCELSPRAREAVLPEAKRVRPLAELPTAPSFGMGRGAEDPFFRFARTHFWMGEDGGRVYPLLEKLIEEGRRPRPGAREMAEALLRQIIVLLMRMYRQEAGPAPMGDGSSVFRTGGWSAEQNVGAGSKTARTVPAVRVPALTKAGLMPIVEDAFFYRHRTLTLKDLASLLNLSQRQTQRLLQNNFGKTFSQKLTDARMAAASQMLTGTDLSVTEIAERSGYSSIEHFSAAFHRRMGCSPREYRKGHRG